MTLQALHVIHKLIDSRTEQISLSSFSVMKHVACAQLRGAYGCWSSRLLKLWHNIIDPPHSILSYWERRNMWVLICTQFLIMAPNPNSMAVAFRPITVLRSAMGWAQTLSAERSAGGKAVGANGWMSIPGWVGELMLRLVVTGTMEVNGG